MNKSFFQAHPIIKIDIQTHRFYSIGIQCIKSKNSSFGVLLLGMVFLKEVFSALFFIPCSLLKIMHKGKP